MSDYLPMEIVEQVLLRLPMKPLLQCTSICKTWYNLITSTEFISKHLDFTKSVPNSNSTKILIEHKCQHRTPVFVVNERNYVVYSDDQSGNFEEYERFTIMKEAIIVRLIGCCNGLICIASNVIGVIQFEEIVLWNPVIRRVVRVPKSKSLNWMRCKLITGFNAKYHRAPPCAFVFDPIGNDYKVLRVHSNCGNCTLCWTYVDLFVVEVFRLSSGSWEDITRKARFTGISGAQVVLKGVAHWIGKYNDNDCKIITFDVHEVVFGSIELPFDVLNDNDQRNSEKYLFVFEESLFLICCVVTEDVHEQRKWNFDVWRMGEYSVVESWIRIHTRVFDVCVIPLGFRKKGEIVWSTNDSIIFTNLVDASHNYIGSCPNKCNASCLYAESLILLDKSLSSAVDGPKLEIVPEHEFFSTEKIMYAANVR